MEGDYTGWCTGAAMLDRLLNKACRLLSDRLPYRVIPRPDGAPYLVRYYLFGGPREETDSRPFNVYLHLFLSGDDEEELHNHPWKHSMSLILTGGYREERRIGDQVVTRTLRPGRLNFIEADDYHRVDLLKDHAWTLFIAGKSTKRSWGFWDRKTGRVVPWRQHIFARAHRQAVEA